LSIDAKVDIEKAIIEIGDQVCIAGNVDPVKILEFGGCHEVIEATKECLRKGTGKGGFILMPGEEVLF
jgi:uroporphyrinogen decarboxylase